MIRLTFFSDPSSSRRTYQGFQMRGHADAGPHGQDLVCCAASTLAIGTVNALQEVLGLEGMRVEFEEGKMDVFLSDQEGQSTIPYSNFALEAFHFNMKELAKEHPESICIQYRKDL